MAVPRGDDQLPHLSFSREPGVEPQRRTRQFPRKAVRSPDDRRVHGREIAAQLVAATEGVQSRRADAGIDPTRLIVLEFDQLDFELSEEFAERLNAQIVDERQRKTEAGDRYTAVLQFESLAAVQGFERDTVAYGEGTRGRLPAGLLQNLLDSLQMVRGLTREDRLGDRLREEGFPDAASFLLDVDLWHPGDPSRAREMVDLIRGLCRENGSRVVHDLRTASMVLLKLRATHELAELLLDLDLVARVDLPPKISAAFSNLSQDLNWPDPSAMPEADDPIVCVIDSGVVAGHPLLTNWVVEERDFDSGEDTATDLNGHGTAVAGLAAYGNVAECVATNIWQPRVRICSAKVLKNEPNPFEPGRPRAVFPEDSERRIEGVVGEAIRYFHAQGCRIFNLSVGDETKVYADGRQSSWAESLDSLVRELDIVIVVTTGNAEPEIPDAPKTRDRLRRAVKNQTLESRVISPGTAALAVTVGSIAQSDGVTENAFGVAAAAPAGGPSPFTRTGPGYAIRPSSKGIKPDLVASGGNWALQALGPNDQRWFEHPALGEPSLQRDYVPRAVRMFFGTSYAAPHVSHAAAVAQVALRDALGNESPACLIRAVVGASARTPQAPRGWYSKEPEKTRIIGYGEPQLARVPWSLQNDSRLVAHDEVEEGRFQLFRIPIPAGFRERDGDRGITISLAFDPPVRGSRKEYMARTMYFVPIIGLSPPEAQAMLERFSGAKDEEPVLPRRNRLDMTPGARRVMYSTLQVRRAEWKAGESVPAMTNSDGDETLLVAVFCQKRFTVDPVDTRQRYGLVVDIWHSSEDVRIYEFLRTRVRQRVRQQVRS